MAQSCRLLLACLLCLHLTGCSGRHDVDPQCFPKLQAAYLLLRARREWPEAKLVLIQACPLMGLEEFLLKHKLHDHTILYYVDPDELYPPGVDVSREIRIQREALAQHCAKIAGRLSGERVVVVCPHGVPADPGHVFAAGDPPRRAVCFFGYSSDELDDLSEVRRLSREDSVVVFVPSPMPEVDSQAYAELGKSDVFRMSSRKIEKYFMDFYRQIE